MADDAANPITELTMKVDRVRTAMGGQKRIDAIHANGQLTVREHIDQLVDEGTFRELGTLAASLDPAQRAGTPGDGKVVGHALIDARPVAVAGDDITVRRGSSSVVGSRKVGRVFDQALKAGEPFVYLGQTGGARIPDALGAEGLAMVPPPVGLAGRRHQIPVVTAIVGPSFGGSSFISARFLTSRFCRPSRRHVPCGDLPKRDRSCHRRGRFDGGTWWHTRPLEANGPSRSDSGNRRAGPRGHPQVPVVPSVERVVTSA